MLQWTDQYGTTGPSLRAGGQAAGSCSSDEDCSPRAPVCSNLGFCTVKDYFEVMFTMTPLVSTTHVVLQKSGLSRGEDSRDPGGRSEAGRSVAPRPRHQRPATNRRNNQNRDKQSHSPSASPSPRPGTTLPHQRSEARPRPPLPLRSASSQEFNSVAAASAPVPGIVQQPDTAARRPSDYYDRKSADYYEDYDYNYYTGFEVLRQDERDSSVSKSIQHKIHGQFSGTADTAQQRRTRPGGARATSAARDSAAHVSTARAHPVAPDSDEDNYEDAAESGASGTSSSSSGCLNDCVTDCVSIQQVAAYRDCVGFCGKTCRD